jgi:uncharacterized protein YsxB (DUF464 family)
LIRVLYKKENLGYSYLKVEGHAPSTFGKKGENILCSAISALTQTLVLALQQDGNLQTKSLENGILEFAIPEPSEKTNIQFEIILNGILNLQKQYSDILKVQNLGV